MANQLDPSVNSNATNRVLAQSITPRTRPTSEKARQCDSDFQLRDRELAMYASPLTYYHFIEREVEAIMRARYQALNSARTQKSDLANKLDPCVDSNSDTRATHGGDCFSAGPNLTAAGPHSSNLVNKVDTRIDSDMDNRPHHQATAGDNCGSPTIGDAPHITSDNPTHKAADPCVGAVPENRVSGADHQRTC
ncbi:hypothetical protein N7493_007742 [Penicillium malachiteum]|uniref:Uncharacterized protein n=1 Tax=Penicillium malachiteum TaxID=1324776 RepID=A0AAD6HI68_9EURO|nr:hypothetical protein N7493_007742 [Penicillium malachiteum]